MAALEIRHLFACCLRQQDLAISSSSGQTVEGVAKGRSLLYHARCFFARSIRAIQHIYAVRSHS